MILLSAEHGQLRPASLAAESMPIWPWLSVPSAGILPCSQAVILGSWARVLK